MQQLVFVYGTLRRGQRYHYLLRSSLFYGLHRTEPQYTMLDLGGFPGVISNGKQAMTGEIYGITARVLRQLDRLEDYPDQYERKLITTARGPAWIYLYQHARGDEPIVTNGDWLR